MIASEEQAREIRTKAEKVLGYRSRRTAGFVIGILVFVLLYGSFYLCRFIWGLWPRLHEILFERGFWPHVIVFFAILALADLMQKLIRQGLTEAFEASDFQLPADRTAHVEDLLALARRLERRTKDSVLIRSAIWARRLAASLLQVARGSSKENVRSAMQVQAEADEAALASRYTLLKLYLWAIPLLGFIGTVEGIGSGIGKFSADLGKAQQAAPAVAEAAAAPGQVPEAVSDRMDQVKESLKNVTDGLGRAFDTTYLALIITVLMMIAASVIEKRDLDRQLRFDELFQTCFVERLPADRPPSPDETKQLSETVEEFGASVETAKRVSREIRNMSNQAHALNQSLARGVNCQIKLDPKGPGK